MDKRYLLIIIIIIVCCINLSFIVNNSDVVGSASVNVGKYLFSVPEGFGLKETNGNSVTIQNNDNNIAINIETNLDESNSYYNRLNYIENETNHSMLSKGTVSIDNITVYTVYYKTSDNNKSAFYFEKDNTQFKIVVSNFNYNSDRDLTLDYVSFIIKSIEYDYKTG